MSDLPPFNASATCAKCAGTDVHTRYFPGDTFEYGCRERREHMHRACRRCGFEWIEDIARPAAPASRTEETRPAANVTARCRKCGTEWTTSRGHLAAFRCLNCGSSVASDLSVAVSAAEPNGSAEGSR